MFDSSSPPRTERQSDIDLASFAKVVAAISRFIYELARIPPFKNSGIGLADWAALSVLASRSGVNKAELARTLGVTGARINQLRSSLKQAGYISAGRSGAGWRKERLRITNRGLTKLNKVNSVLEPLIRSLPKSGNRLVDTHKEIERLMQIISFSHQQEENV